MPIPCPGSDSFRKTYAADGEANSARRAFTRAITKISVAVSTDVELLKFLVQRCERGCSWKLSGGKISRYGVTIWEQDERWQCDIFAHLEATIDCEEREGSDGGDVDAVLAEIVEGILGENEGASD